MRIFRGRLRALTLFRAGAVVMTIGLVIGTASEASAATRLGGLNIQRYCEATKIQGFDVTRQYLGDKRNPYTWGCLDSLWFGPPIGWAQVGRGIDMTQACRMQHGKGAYARVLDQHNAYSWKCYR